jgi:hypothetical protein
MAKNTGAGQNNPRQERLAKALRDNLKRRKAQARGRAAGSQPQGQASRSPERKG